MICQPCREAAHAAGLRIHASPLSAREDRDLERWAAIEAEVRRRTGPMMEVIAELVLRLGGKVLVQPPIQMDRTQVWVAFDHAVLGWRIEVKRDGEPPAGGGED